MDENGTKAQTLTVVIGVPPHLACTLASLPFSFQTSPAVPFYDTISLLMDC